MQQPATSMTTYKRHMLILLSVILAFNQVDRVALGVLLQDIKLDLALSDTQLGLLTGIAFALFYSVMGIPIARWADRGNRVTIITLTTAVWSAAVALMGLAAAFLHMLLIRIVVAVGEAGCLPPAHSLIAEYFTRAERPRAVARYMLGLSLANVLGFVLAGWLNEFYGWRMTFMLLGLPGLGLAAMAWFTLREPRREKPAINVGSQLGPAALTSSPGIGALSPVHPSLKEVCLTLWADATFRHLLLMYSVASFFGSGITQWWPTFFVRSHGLETGELGTWFAVAFGACGIIGIYLGGEVVSRYAKQNERLQLKGAALLCVCLGLVSILIYLSPNKYMAFGWIALTTVGFCMTTGPFFAMIQTLVPERMRAVSIALVYLAANLVGMGLGPLAAGALSDALRPWFGEESLRYALMALSPGYVWAGWHYWRASKTVTRDVEAVQLKDDRVAREGESVTQMRHEGAYGRSG